MDVSNNVSNAVKLAKKLLNLEAVANDANAKIAIADLQVQLAELKSHLAVLIEENTILKQKLQAATSEVSAFVIKDGMYYRPNDDGPFCTACYDSNQKTIRLTELGGAFNAIAKWRCNVCKATYGGTL